MSAARSAIMMVGELVLPEVIRGMIEASAMRNPSSPCTRRRVHHRALVRSPAHRAGAHRMEDGGADLAGRLAQLVLAAVGRTGQPFLGPVAAQRGRGRDAPRQPYRIGRHLQVFIRAQVVGPDQRRRLRIGPCVCTLPRDVGRRLHTLAVKASKLCNGSPKAPSDSGCTWNSTLARAWPSSERANRPSCDGAMLIGPLRLSRYSRPMPALPHQVAASRFSVLTPCTLMMTRSCRWSCRFSPTPGNA